MADMWNDLVSYFNGTVAYNVTGYIAGCRDTTCPNRSDWDSYMWSDELHPSEQSSRVVASEFVKVVEGKSNYAEYWSSWSCHGEALHGLGV